MAIYHAIRKFRNCAFSVRQPSVWNQNMILDACTLWSQMLHSIAFTELASHRRSLHYLLEQCTRTYFSSTLKHGIGSYRDSWRLASCHMVHRVSWFHNFRYEVCGFFSWFKSLSDRHHISRLRPKSVLHARLAEKYSIVMWLSASLRTSAYRPERFIFVDRFKHIIPRNPEFMPFRSEALWSHEWLLKEVFETSPSIRWTFLVKGQILSYCGHFIFIARRSYQSTCCWSLVHPDR
jgi:hypothetical protein